MKWFRHTLQKSRVFILTLLAVELFYMTDGRQFIYAHEVYEQKEARLREISELLGLPIEKLRPDHESLFDSVKNLFVGEVDPVKEAGLKRLKEVLRKNEEQVAANPYLPQIEQVKREHAPYRIEGVIQDLMQLTQPKNGKALPEASQRAILRNLHHALQEDLTLPLTEGLPAKAQAKHAEMQAKLDRLFDSVRPIVAETQHAEMKGTLAQKIGALRMLQAVETKRPSRPPRFVDRPLPLRRVEKKARSEEMSAELEAFAKSGVRVTPSVPREVISKDGIAPEILALAESLDNSPAAIFEYVHNNMDYDPKWGAFQGPLGTLWEKSGTSWDQAWLLRDLLTASGVDARFEWGEVQVSTELLTNITGLDDPWRAGDLLTTAGVPIVLLTQGSQVVGARMSHVWVKAFVDYFPNRGATPGPGDTWIRMDPSLKRYEYSKGIQVHDRVTFSLSDYLLSGTVLSPRRAHEEALWAHIRENNLSCTTLEQLKKAPSVLAQHFPFLPGTLRGKVLQVNGEASELPVGFRQQLQVDVRAASGSPLVSWGGYLPDFYAERVELAWVGATPDDQATLESHGGVFETPPYLVDLRPVIKVTGVDQTSGASIGSAEAVEVFVTLTPVDGPPEVFVHDAYAGEPSVVVAAFSRTSQDLLRRTQEELLSASVAGDVAAVQATTLQLLGTTYLHNLGRDLDDIGGWNWNRLVRLVSEGLITQTGNVSASVDGSPLTFTRAETYVDFPGLVVGLFHVSGETDTLKATLELAGAHGSFLEGEIFNQVMDQEGISAIHAMTLSNRNGQSLTVVDASNVDVVLESVDLGLDVENEVRAAVGQGKVAWIPESSVTLNQWIGVGYILEDPSSGAAAYLISGGLAGGSNTGLGGQAQDLLGNEPWLMEGPLGPLLGKLVELFGSGDGPGSNQSDPVNMSTGNMWFTDWDLTIFSRGLPVSWNRTYNSRSNRSGPFGLGWTFNYGVRLEEGLDGSILYLDEDGTEHVFEPDGVGGYLSPAGKHLSLTRGAEFTLETKHGQKSTFALDGRLLTIADTNGSTILLDYDSQDNLIAVIDAAGRTVLTVTTQAGRIIRIEDLAGRKVEFGYDAGALTTITDLSGKIWTYAYDSEQNLTSKANPLGNSDFYAYDRLDRCIRHVDAVGSEENFYYSSRGSRAILTDRRGFDTFLDFDERGRATLQVDPLGNASRSTWDDANNRLSITNAQGGTFTRIYDVKGNLLSESNPLGQTTRYTYEPTFSRTESVRNAAGHVVNYSYDTKGNLTEVAETVGGTIQSQSLVFNNLGEILEHRNADGLATTLTWDPATGGLASQTNVAGHTTTYKTDELGRVTEAHEPDLKKSTYVWDDKDRLTTMVDVYGKTVQFIYDDAGRRTAIITPEGETTFEYDAVGRVVSTTNPLGNATTTRHDAAGNPTETVDANGNRTTTSYDAIGRPVATVDPQGGVQSFGYCGDFGGANQGAFCETTDPLGNMTRQEQDILGRIKAITDPLGHTTQIAYDELGRRSEVTDALDRTTRFEYDERGRLTAVVEANGSRTEYSYDVNDSLTNIKDAESREWTRIYNGLNQLVEKSDPLGNATEYFYDTSGNPVRTKRPNGDEIDYSYELGQVARIDLPGGAVETFSYDSSGRLETMINSEVSISYTYDALHRPVAVTNETLGQSIAYTYDKNGNQTSLSGPRGLVTYLYDSTNRLAEQRDPIAGTYRFTYDAAGRRIARIDPNGITTEYSYDDDGRLVGLIARNRGTEIIDGYSYEYDKVGNRIRTTALRAVITDTYEYDAVNRLTRWERGPGRFEEYSYDLVGNRTSLLDQAGVVNYTYNDANRLLTEDRVYTGGDSQQTTFDWDFNGRLTQKSVGASVTTYGWDALGRLVSLSDYTFGYDPQGVRARETTPTSSRRMLYAGEDMVGVYDDSLNLTVYYSHGPGIDEPLAQETTEGLNYLHQDGLGSVTALSDSDGQLSGAASHAAFGGVEGQSGMASRYGYTGREIDPTGLTYYRSRYLDPSVGRFLSQDSYSGDPSLVASLHRYTYAHNNPILHKDPSGNSPFLLLSIKLYFLFVQLAPILLIVFLVGVTFLLAYRLGIILREVFGLGPAMMAGEETFLRNLGIVVFSLGLLISLVPNTPTAQWQGTSGPGGTAGQCTQAAQRYIGRWGATLQKASTFPQRARNHAWIDFFRIFRYDPTLRDNLAMYGLPYGDIIPGTHWFTVLQHNLLLQRLVY